MKPIVLIHGYSSESAGSRKSDITTIYGDLPRQLAKQPEVGDVVPVNVSRYITLHDSVSIDDITLAFDRALKTKHPELLESGFNAIVHSTGALVIRNWVRRSALKPAKVDRIIHLAGANLGSGWAHIGESLLVKWLRYIGQGGAARGLAVLEALELGSSWTLDLHHHFLEPKNDMLTDYGTMEFNIVGTQVPPAWFVIPFRYGKEDGSDGVVRVSASNLNFHYLAIGPSENPSDINWTSASAFAKKATSRSADGKTSLAIDQDGVGGGYYTLLEDSRPETREAVGPVTRPRHPVPFAIPYQCAHSGPNLGIVSGTDTRTSVLELVTSALTCEVGSYRERVTQFDAATVETYRQAKSIVHAEGFAAAIKRALGTQESGDPKAQYDKHSQVVFRLNDQNGMPVKDYSIYFNSRGGDGRGQQLIDGLFQDHHRNNCDSNIITFYLRTARFNAEFNDWKSGLPEINGIDLEIDAIDTDPTRILYVPLRLRITSEQLQAWIQPHRTTIIDIRLLRLPSDDTFLLY